MRAKAKITGASVFERDAERRNYARVNIGKPDVVPFANMVLICGEQILRPPSISPSQWLAFWERVTSL